MQHHGRDLHYIALLDEWNIVVSKRYDEVTELFDYPMYNISKTLFLNETIYTSSHSSGIERHLPTLLFVLKVDRIG
jgi:hypothetical protein